MRKEVVEIDKEKGIYRITTTDERWYTLEQRDPKIGLPSFKFIPSVTWITNYYPKGVAFFKWLANKGWDEAEALKVEAGDKGSKIHKAIENLILGLPVKMEDKYWNNSKEVDEELTPDEYRAIYSFKQWHDAVKPEFLLSETTVISEQYNFAGTVDAVCKIGDQAYIIDFKSSQYIWPSMELQLSAYKQALKEAGRKTTDVKLAVLQLGYKRNKHNYKFTEIPDQFDLFLSARSIWEKETKGQSPTQIELPLELKIEKPSRPKKPSKKSNKITKK